MAFPQYTALTSDMETGMKIASVFFYQAVQIKGKMINSANEKDYDIEYKDNLCFVTDHKQGVTVAVPYTNIPQMQVSPEALQPKNYPNLEKAWAAKAAKKAPHD